MFYILNTSLMDAKFILLLITQSLVSLFRKSLTSASPRLSRMLLHILDYQLDVMYQPGTKMHLSDALSRLISHNNNSKAEPIKGLDVTVHDVQIFTEISPLSLAKSRHVTENDPDLKTLRQYIQDGFPANRSDCAESVQAYFGFREETSYCQWPNCQRSLGSDTQPAP